MCHPFSVWREESVKVESTISWSVFLVLRAFFLRSYFIFLLLFISFFHASCGLQMFFLTVEWMLLFVVLKTNCYSQFHFAFVLVPLFVCNIRIFKVIFAWMTFEVFPHLHLKNGQLNFLEFFLPTHKIKKLVELWVTFYRK